MIDYEGDDIMISEMPQGCVIMGYGDRNTITVSSQRDALALIASLQKMLQIQFGEENDK